MPFISYPLVIRRSLIGYLFKGSSSGVNVRREKECISGEQLTREELTDRYDSYFVR